MKNIDNANPFDRQVLQIAGLGIWQIVTNKPMKKSLRPVDDPRWNEKSGVFVTLRKNGRIRGSVGMLESGTCLQETLFDAGANAATHDHRFEPVTEEEIPAIDMEVTILSEVKTLTSADQLRIGQAGLIVSQGEKRGVLLPHVPVERGWQAREFLEACCEKADLPHDAWNDPNTLVESFRGHTLRAQNLLDVVEEFV